MKYNTYFGIEIDSDNAPPIEFRTELTDTIINQLPEINSFNDTENSDDLKKIL